MDIVVKLKFMADAYKELARIAVERGMGPKLGDLRQRLEDVASTGTVEQAETFLARIRSLADFREDKVDEYLTQVPESWLNEEDKLRKPSR